LEARGAAAWPGPDTILIANKIDLLRSPKTAEPHRCTNVIPGLDPGIHEAGSGAAHLASGVDGRDEPGHDESEEPPKALAVSALTGEGIDALLSALGAWIAESYLIEVPVLTRARHREALEEAAASLQRALRAPLPELHSEDLRLALRSLGRITGTVDVEDLLDVIFRDFCIGK
jgi:tRNA U34 5-carboxymethylaminomethyl modifying GTPase MnmE/TrmE